MYLVNTAIAVTITRNKQDTPPSVVKVRLLKPNGVQEYIPHTSTNPTLGTTGTVTLSLAQNNVDLEGMYKIDLLSGIDPYTVIGSTYLHVTTSSNAFATTI